MVCLPFWRLIKFSERETCYEISKNLKISEKEKRHNPLSVDFSLKARDREIAGSYS